MQEAEITRDPRKYVQITEDLRQKIRAGLIGSNAPVSIAELSREWKTSRETTAKAVHILARDGLLRRYPGVGYYVTARTRPARATTQPEEDR